MHCLAGHAAAAAREAAAWLARQCKTHWQRPLLLWYWINLNVPRTPAGGTAVLLVITYMQQYISLPNQCYFRKKEADKNLTVLPGLLIKIREGHPKLIIWFSSLLLKKWGGCFPPFQLSIIIRKNTYKHNEATFPQKWRVFSSILATN